MAIKKRCIRCMKVLREDGTCQNPKCSRYTEEVVKEEEMAAESTPDNTEETKK